MKYCYKCQQELDEKCFSKHNGRPDGLQKECKVCQGKRKIPKEYLTAYRIKTKRLVFEHYSKCNEIKCASCGFTDIRALSLDHIDGNGAAHRKEICKNSHCGSATLYTWLVANNFPEGFQILCMNCQFIKRAENNECASSLVI